MLFQPKKKLRGGQAHPVLIASLALSRLRKPHKYLRRVPRSRTAKLYYYTIELLVTSIVTVFITATITANTSLALS